MPTENHIIRNVFVVLSVVKVWMVFHLPLMLQIKIIALKIFTSKYRHYFYYFKMAIAKKNFQQNILMFVVFFCRLLL